MAGRFRPGVVAHPVAATLLDHPADRLRRRDRIRRLRRRGHLPRRRGLIRHRLPQRVTLRRRSRRPQSLTRRVILRRVSLQGKVIPLVLEIPVSLTRHRTHRISQPLLRLLPRRAEEIILAGPVCRLMLVDHQQVANRPRRESRLDRRLTAECQQPLKRKKVVKSIRLQLLQSRAIRRLGRPASLSP